MDRLIEYVTHHPLLAGAVLVALIVVFAFEARQRGSTFASISSQDLIRLMNQGALVLDIRKTDEFAQGHVNGAKHLPSDQILTASENFKRFKEKPVVVYCDSGSLAAAAVRQLNAQGFTKAFTLRGGFAGWCGEPAGRQGSVMSAPAVVMYVTSWCPYCERARRLLASKGAAVEEIDVESSSEKRAEMLARSGRRSVPQIFIGDQHVGGSDDLAELEAAGKLDTLLGR